MDRTRIVLFLSLGILVTAFLVIGVSLLITPKQATSPISDAEVLKIGIRYVEETYGTDYCEINGGVGESTVSNETGIWTYPTAYFKTPADLQKPGIRVAVMVNPETGEIFDVLINMCKPFHAPLE